MSAIERKCSSCGMKFIIRPYDVATGNPDYKFCYSCNRKWREGKRIEREKIENEKWTAQRARDQAEFEEKLKKWNAVDISAIYLSSPLYIIGNGFDLMHGVKSSYRDFSKTLGKHSDLKMALETWLTADDIWSDFEGALAYLNVEGMASDYIVDMWLDGFDAFNPDGQAADYFAAIDTAASPIAMIADELPKRFRTWIESLAIGTEDRPLQRLFVDGGKVLCFNYTEFVEELYGMKEVCYIHGSRKRKKGQPKSKLILGHMTGASDEAFDAFSQNYKSHIKNPGKRAMVEMAQDDVLRLIGEYDEELTKNSLEIISQHSDFFDSLGDRESIVVIGHSYSEVDWDYFREVISKIEKRNTVQWFFGCHSLRDLGALQSMISRLGIKKYSIFRTDTIQVKLKESDQAVGDVNKKQLSNEKRLKRKCISANGKWEVRTLDGHFRILSHVKADSKLHTDGDVKRLRMDEKIVYEAEFPYHLDKAFFTADSAYILILFRGREPGVCVYRRNGDDWMLVGELESIPNQCLINPRLKHVYINGCTATFVYNSHERTYSMENGELLERKRRKYDSSRHYDGVDVVERFYRK